MREEGARQKWNRIPIAAQWFVQNSRRSMVYGLWSMVYGLWSMVYGLWSMVYGLWSMVYGLWSMVYGLWSKNLQYIFCTAPPKPVVVEQHQEEDEPTSASKRK